MHKLRARSHLSGTGDTSNGIQTVPPRQRLWRAGVVCLLLVAGCSNADKNNAPIPDPSTAGGTSGPVTNSSHSQPDSATGDSSSAGGGNSEGATDTDSTGGSGGQGDTGSVSSSGTGTSGSAEESSTDADPNSEDEESAGNEYGFDLRVPAVDDLDWLCTFGQSESSGYVYVRLTQTGEDSVGFVTVPVYTASLAQISIGGTVSTLDNPAYDYGGGHHNDSLQFDYAGKTYKYYHSSFGFGFRKCQPMDCIDVYGVGATTPETEGCSPDRKLPEVCVQIQSDGSHAPLVDSFQKCPGDQN